MMTTIELLDVVALTSDRLDEGLLREQVGTVVETLVADRSGPSRGE